MTMGVRLAILALAALAVAGIARPLPLAAEPYRLHGQDRLLIRVLTWDFTKSSPVGWQDLSGEYSLSPEGVLQLPLAGEIAAGGLTQSEFASVVSDLLRRRAGLDEAPMLSIELVSSLPVYVLGHVETRGAVAFHPSLSARQALALAGGTFRGASDPLRIASASAALRSADATLARLLAERDSLQAELKTLQPEAPSAGPSADAPMPSDAPPGADADALARLQQADKAARMVRMESFDQLRTVLAEKSERLNLQLKLRDEQIARTRKELDGITSLYERGLTVNTRVTSLSTSLSDMETRRLELETALLLLEEQRNQANRDSSTLVADTVVDRLRRLAELEGLIDAARLDRDSARMQAALLSTLADDDADKAAAAPGFMLTRDGVTTSIEPNTLLLPGDTLEIVLQDPASAGAEDAP